MSEPNFTKVKAYSRIADLANAIRAITRLGNTEGIIRNYAEEIILQCGIIAKENSIEEWERVRKAPITGKDLFKGGETRGGDGHV